MNLSIPSYVPYVRWDTTHQMAKVVDYVPLVHPATLQVHQSVISAELDNTQTPGTKREQEGGFAKQCLIAGVCSVNIVQQDSLEM